MTKKIKSFKTAKEIISNKNKEIKELTKKLDTIKSNYDIILRRNRSLSSECKELRKDAKEKDMYKYAFSVCLAAVDERRLAWSMAQEYKHQKEIYDDKRAHNNFINDLATKLGKGVNSEKLDLDKIFNDFLGKKKK
jgi:cell division septum initiation protein DivIVA